jgi:hypothetical protein
MPTPADQQNKDNLPLLHHPENSHHTPSTSNHRVPSNTFKKENDDNAAAAQTSPRVSPGTLWGVEKRYTRGPSGRKAAPAGVTASVLDEPNRDFS